MKHIVLVALLLMLACVAAHAADGPTATQTVTIDVKEVALVNVGTNAPAFTVDMATATAGAAPAVTPTDNVTTIKYTSVLPSTGTAKKITLGLANAVPAGLTLKATTTAASGAGTGTSGVTIGTGAADIVTAIPTCWTDSTGTASSTLTLTVNSLPTALKANAVGTPYSTTATYTIVGS
jgi:hypothetical protein